MLVSPTRQWFPIPCPLQTWLLPILPDYALENFLLFPPLLLLVRRWWHAPRSLAFHADQAGGNFQTTLITAMSTQHCFPLPKGSRTPLIWRPSKPQECSVASPLQALPRLIPSAMEVLGQSHVLHYVISQKCFIRYLRNVLALLWHQISPKIVSLY